MIYISRAALQVVRDDDKENTRRLQELITMFCEKNKIQYRHISAIIFSQTDDIDFLNPATLVRKLEILPDVSLFCAKEPLYPHSLPYTVRLLLFVRHFSFFKKLQPVYAFGAECLRKDIQ